MCIIVMVIIVEELPKKAKSVMGIYATAVAAAEGTAVFFGFGKDDMIVFFVFAVILATALSYIYIVLYFKNYRYYISDGMIIIKKGALFKRRHLIYVDKISLITVKENFVHRWFSLCTIWFNVQGSVVRLSFVPVEKSEQLKEILDSRH